MFNVLEWNPRKCNISCEEISFKVNGGMGGGTSYFKKGHCPPCLHTYVTMFCCSAYFKYLDDESWQNYDWQNYAFSLWKYNVTGQR